MKRILSGALSALYLLAGGCATVDPNEVSAIARPDQAPSASITEFEQPLQCMDRLFADYGVKDVTIAVSGVPDYTGRAFVGSDFWLQTAISKMSQRSGAFRVTDYNPNQLQPEQGLWSLSDKSGFYIPAYYIRGAISGFANNIADNRGNVGIGTSQENAGAGFGESYSTVSVDLTVGNLLQRTLINRAHAGNEVVMQSRSSGAQLGGFLSKFGANVEIVASRSDGIPQAVRALVELNAIEILGRLTGAPYWTCLGAAPDDPEAARAREDIFYDMSVPERIVFVQRRLSRLGYYAGPLNGQGAPDLDRAVTAYRKDRSLADGATIDLALYARLTDWKADNAMPRPPAPQSAAQAPPATQPSAPVGAPKSEQAALPRPTARDPSAKPFSFDILLLQSESRPGAPVSLSLQANQSTFAYCYIEEASGSVARIFPNRLQPDPLIQPGSSVKVPPDRNNTFTLVLPEGGKHDTVACFASKAEIGARLPENLRVDDLSPLPVPSLANLGALYEDNAQALQAELVVKKTVLAPK